MTNDTAHDPGIHLPWAGKTVRMDEIEEVLASLWKMSADNLRTGANVRVRTSVLNLVICAPDIETAQRTSKILRELSSTHLARVTLLILDNEEHAPSSLHAWVTLRCFSMISDLMRHCFEQTTILASGSAVRSVANIIQPLLKPDLPVYLWWLGDPPDRDDPTFIGLVEISSRMIVDSTGFFNPEQDIITLSALFDTTPECALSDLNWGRITPWRQLISQFFDVPEYRSYLNGVTSIEIEHSVAPLATQMRTELGDVSPNPARALLLAGWLKERLGWSLAEDTTNNDSDTGSGTYFWSMARLANARSTRSLTPTRVKPTPGNIASISIRPRVSAEMRPGSIFLVRLISNLDNKQATFTISLEDEMKLFVTSIELSHETRARRSVSLAAVQNESDLLHDELEILGHDYQFEQTLKEVTEMLAAEK
ncbi:MAG TPA: glucose-6-phosphate dehydrogenase assembly protein OpcA [Ktedonobacteraceae bacterium]|nr:glucose-6-phosphate dehydrogenase assembly protein OpcA [Ktedonobacteraceae bacterium]